MTELTQASAAELVATMTTEEKASLTSGASFWSTKAVERVGVPALVLTDGPHGVRLQAGDSDHLGLNASVPATCFPPAVNLGAAFDPELAEQVGNALGEEAKAEGVHVLLGPGVNIKRSPLCGRNFEYVSEDPILSGAIGAGLVTGLQSQGVGCSLKHFAANNQETDRLRVSSDIDPRPLREIYLRGFERVVRDAKPWTLMCSYNRVNGVYASENPWLLSQVLREEWGFDGTVVSDWGAVNDRVAGLPAGLDLEMPASSGQTDAQLVAAVRDGRLDEDKLDLAARRIIELVQRATAASDPAASYDVGAHHGLAREVAGRSIVLLKNEGGSLPVRAGQNVAVIGEFARTPRYQGAGSSQINPTRLDNALDELRHILGAEALSFAPGFTLDRPDTPADPDLLAAAVCAASGTDLVLAFLGLPAEAESEGYDRTHLRLPATQLEVLDAVIAANPNVVVVLSNGSVVELPFADRVPAVVEGWLGGQAAGGALADVLTGRVNPSARLTETIPLRLEDTPAFLDFPGEFGHVRYAEGLFVGYRWYDARDIPVRYPFGHGLSYTTFAYSDLSVTADDEGIAISLTVANTGPVAGREIVQAYLSLPSSRTQRPVRELKSFRSIELDAGESRRVVLRVRRTDLAYWDIRVDRFVVEGGAYRVEAGASSRDLRLSGEVTVTADDVRVPLTMDSTIGEMLEHPVAGPLIRQSMAPMLAQFDEQMMQMVSSFLIGRVTSFPGSGIGAGQLRQLLAAANAQ